MKKIILIAITPLILFSYQIHLKIAPVKKHQGEILIAVYKEKKNFLDMENFYKGMAIPANKETLTYTFQDIPVGTYAIAVYHDENSNKKFDRYFFGAPKEAFGFSQNPTINFAEPNFDECKFKLNKDIELTIEVHH